MNLDANDVKKIDESLEKLAIDFVYNLETKGVNLILTVKEDWFNIVSSKDRESMLLVFDKMIDIYYDVMNLKIGKEIIRCDVWKDKIVEIASFNSVDSILKKINILIDYKDSIKFNVNGNLLMDSLIISIGGIENGSRY